MTQDQDIPSSVYQAEIDYQGQVFEQMKGLKELKASFPADRPDLRELVDQLRSVSPSRILDGIKLIDLKDKNIDLFNALNIYYLPFLEKNKES